jgi:hypothetical protein
MILGIFKYVYIQPYHIFATFGLVRHLIDFY